MTTPAHIWSGIVRRVVKANAPWSKEFDEHRSLVNDFFEVLSGDAEYGAIRIYVRLFLSCLRGLRCTTRFRMLKNIALQRWEITIFTLIDLHEFTVTVEVDLRVPFDLVLITQVFRAVSFLSGSIKNIFLTSVLSAVYLSK